MNITDVMVSAIKLIIKSGRDVIVTFNHDGTIEIKGFRIQEDEKAEKDIFNGIPKDDLVCDYCQHGDKREYEYPCNECVHNAYERFERINYA